MFLYLTPYSNKMDGLKCGCNCYSLIALNVMDLGKKRKNYLSNTAHIFKWDFLSLELSKRNRNGIEFKITHCLLKESPLRLVLETDQKNFTSIKKYLYLKEKLSRPLKWDLFSDYIHLINKQLKSDLLQDRIELLLVKFLKVGSVLQPPVELSDKNVTQYEFMAELLNICCKVDVRNSQPVVSLLRMTVDRCGVGPLNPLYIRQPSYPVNFLKYLLEHARKEKFDLEDCCSTHPRTLWEYSRNFSVLKAVASGDEHKLLTLLQYGVDILPDFKQKKHSKKYLNNDQNLPRRFVIVFRLMNSIRSTNCLLWDSVTISSNKHDVVTEKQKECFRLVWRSTPEPYVRQNEFLTALIMEYSFMNQYFILNRVKYENKRKLFVMYEKHFLELASGPTEPRPLKHLCRCSIRQRLKEMWRLPHDIFRLPLPGLLQRYLNLERE